MATLTGQKIKDTYDGLLKTVDSTTGLPSSGKTTIQDGLGNDSSLKLGRSGNGAEVTGGISTNNTIQVTGNDHAVTFDAGTKIIGDHSVDGLQIRTSDTDDIVFKTNGNNTRVKITGLGVVEVDGELTVNNIATFDDTVQMNDNLTVTNNGYIGVLKFDTLTDNNNSPSINKIVTEAEGIANNDNDTSIPTSAAVKDLVDTISVSFDWLSTTETNGYTDTLAITLRNSAGSTLEQFFFNSQGLQLSKLTTTENAIVGQILRINNNGNSSTAAFISGSAIIKENGNLYLASTPPTLPSGSGRVISAGDGHGYTGVVKNFLNVGFNNDIDDTKNSAAVGQNNTMNEADASVVMGSGNNIDGSGITADTMRSLALGFNNDVRGYSSAALGGNNDVLTGQNGFALGFDNNLTSGGDNNFAIGERNTQSGTNGNGVFMVGVSLHAEDGEMAVGYRNKRSDYPTPDYSKGLGETKVVIGTGTSDDATGLIFTEGGVNRGGGVAQKTRVIFPSVTDFNFSSDSNAAAGGIPVGGMYHNNGDLKIRLT